MRRAPPPGVVAGKRQRLAKSMKPRSTSVWMSSTRTDRRRRGPRIPDHLALGGRAGDAHPGALLGGARHDPVEALADARDQQQRGRGFAHLALDLVGIVLLQRAVAGERRQLARSNRAACARRAPPSTGVARRDPESGGSAPWNACSRAPPGRSGPRCLSAGRSTAYSPEPSILTTDSERSGKALRVHAPAASSRNSSSAFALGVGGSARQAPRRARRCGPSASGRAARAAATRNPCCSRNRAPTPLAAIMKSSISSFARFRSSGRMSTSLPS